ncbi:MAG: hypothetical protein ACK5AZ_03505 [Bryobacteraceae bacterium]
MKLILCVLILSIAGRLDSSDRRVIPGLEPESAELKLGESTDLLAGVCVGAIDFSTAWDIPVRYGGSGRILPISAIRSIPKR